MAKKLEIELVRSLIGNQERLRVVARTLGLTKMHKKVLMPDNPCTRGQIARIRHMVKVQEVEGN